MSNFNTPNRGERETVFKTFKAQKTRTKKTKFYLFFKNTPKKKKKKDGSPPPKKK